MIGIRPSTYYYRPKVDPQVREKQDADLKEKIEVIQVENPGYGYRRVYHHMRRAGAKING